MKTKKKSFYQSRIESLKTQNEAEFEAFKELLSPAAYEKLQQAQSKLPPVSSRQSLRNFNTIKTKKDVLDKRKQKPYVRNEAGQAHIIMLTKQDEEQIETFPYKSTETFEKEAELQEVLNKSKKGTRKSQLALTMRQKSNESKESELSNGSALDEQDSFELWEPKVELLESEEDAQFEPNFAKQSELDDIEKEAKEAMELPVSYVSVVELKSEHDGVEFQGQPQIFQLSAVSEEGLCELIEVKSELEDSLSYLPVEQHSNYYVLN